MNLIELEIEAWKIGRSGDQKAIAKFSSQSEFHSMLMSGRLKFKGRPKTKSGVPVFWLSERE